MLRCRSVLDCLASAPVEKVAIRIFVLYVYVRWEPQGKLQVPVIVFTQNLLYAGIDIYFHSFLPFLCGAGVGAAY